jgi:hypothetical protein
VGSAEALHPDRPAAQLSHATGIPAKELESRRSLLEHAGCPVVLFDHVVAAQQVAFDAFRPGVTCADVDRAVLDYFDENGIREVWRQS